jgi:hypothetical protein
MWSCKQCGEQLDDQFDSCWKCAGGKSAPRPREASPPPKELACARCGSKRVIPGGRVAMSNQVDEGEPDMDVTGELMAAVAAKPRALLDKAWVYGGLRATICADCGATELWADNKAELYEAYEQSELLEEAMKNTKCLCCGQTIPGDHDRCPKCGWSYAEGQAAAKTEL